MWRWMNNVHCEEAIKKSILIPVLVGILALILATDSP